ncbi:hypothetical protein Goklo_023797 [Gossypium klotzschianum]|uniref:Uncharacterized protein n=1 Tax=Gossypium klotzschianum TaxID=34286 RepID=A0A7J8TRW8_9ROSI|nr:hypothetical protein [Gossypium klotzschianum]
MMMHTEDLQRAIVKRVDERSSLVPSKEEEEEEEEIPLLRLVMSIYKQRKTKDVGLGTGFRGGGAVHTANTGASYSGTREVKDD